MCGTLSFLAVRARLGTTLFTGRPPFLDPLTLHLKVISVVVLFPDATWLTLFYPCSMVCNAMSRMHLPMTDEILMTKINFMTENTEENKWKIMQIFAPIQNIPNFLRWRLLPKYKLSNRLPIQGKFLAVTWQLYRFPCHSLTESLTAIVEKHYQRALWETCDPWDMWPEW